jgi:hypothetical protein
MSRNFELLQSITETETSTRDSVPSEPFEPPGCPDDIPMSLLGTQRPSLLVHHDVRTEIAKLTHTVFLSPRTSSSQLSWPAAIAFFGFERSASEALLTAIASDVLSQEVSNVRVCAIDADFAHPTLHQQFGIPQCAGLAEAFEHPVAPHRFTRRVASNLWIMCAGGWSEDVESKRKITSDGALTLLNTLKKSFGYILINGGCTIDSSNSLSLGRAGCSLILVIHANSTRHSTAMKYKKSLITSNVNLLGTVLLRTSTVPSLHNIFSL